MTQIKMSELLNVPTRTLRDWKSSRKKLYTLLEVLDYTHAKKLLSQKDNQDVIELLENQNYFADYRVFERKLFNFLVSGRDTNILKRFSKDKNLSTEARARAAYLYTFLTKKELKLDFVPNQNTGLYHKRQNKSGDSVAALYLLLSGVDPLRFNQYKTKGTN